MWGACSQNGKQTMTIKKKSKVASHQDNLNIDTICILSALHVLRVYIDRFFRSFLYLDGVKNGLSYSYGNRKIYKTLTKYIWWIYTLVTFTCTYRASVAEIPPIVIHVSYQG